MTISLYKKGDQILLYDGEDKITTFIGKTIEDVKSWIEANILNARVVFKGGM